MRSTELSNLDEMSTQESGISKKLGYVKVTKHSSIVLTSGWVKINLIAIYTVKGNDLNLVQAIKLNSARSAKKHSQ